MRLTRPAVTLWIVSAFVAVALLALPVVAFAATKPVTIQNFAFAPKTLTINVGDRVTWTNNDVAAHTSTSDNGLWNTGALQQGEGGGFTFTVPGTFGYHCMIHTSMTGTIIVLAAATAPPTAPPTIPPTPVPTIRTPAPTVAPTVAATVAPTAEPSTSASPSTPPSPSTSAAPSPSATPTASTVAAVPSATTSTTQAVPSDAGPGPALVVGAIVAVAGLAGLAFVIARRR